MNRQAAPTTTIPEGWPSTDYYQGEEPMMRVRIIIDRPHEWVSAEVEKYGWEQGFHEEHEFFCCWDDGGDSWSAMSGDWAASQIPVAKLIRKIEKSKFFVTDVTVRTSDLRKSEEDAEVMLITKCNGPGRFNETRSPFVTPVLSSEVSS